MLIQNAHSLVSNSFFSTRHDTSKYYATSTSFALIFGNLNKDILRVSAGESDIRVNTVHKLGYTNKIKEIVIIKKNTIKYLEIFALISGLCNVRLVESNYEIIELENL